MRPLFISFTAVSHSGSMCNACCQVVYDKPVVGLESTKEIVKALEEKYKEKYLYDTIVINNWRRFEELE